MSSDIQQRISRFSGAMLLLFLVLIAWQSYWHLFASDWLLRQTSNRRMSRVERSTPRGSIYDRNGTRLAWSEQGTRKYAPDTGAVLGYVDPRYGRVGVEGAWNLELAGLSTKFSADELHRLVRHEKPHGQDLVLTLDQRLQHTAQQALGDKHGAVVFLDPATGAVLALASAPTYDPNTLGDQFAQLSQRDDGVLRNRATQDLYPPGSTMKVVTASAALMNGVDPGTTYTCLGKTPLRGTTITDYHGEKHGTVDMTRALAHSCNYYFARTAVEMGQSDLVNTAKAFGFNQAWWDKLSDPRLLPVTLAESSLAPNPARRLPVGELAQMGFGQATVVATPLQMAMVASAVANDGTLMAPYLVSELRKGDTAAVAQTFTSRPIGYPLDAKNAGTLADMMRRVVTSGTAVGANLRGATVYGKTGTAQQTGGDDHAWFIGFAEAQQGGVTHRVAFAVLIERGGTGGLVAVPVARQVIQAWVNTLGH